MADWRSEKRRRYSEAFKRRIVAEASAAGISASAVARRHGLNANLIFNWRRRFGTEQSPDLQASFVPAVIVPDGGADAPADIAGAGLVAPLRSRLEIVCHGGRRIVVEGGFDADLLRRLLAVVEDR
jgi:transposase